MPQLLLATDRATTLRYIRYTHTHTHTPCTPAQQVSLCSLCSCGLFWNISICIPASETPPFSSLAMTLTIALCAVCYFYRGDIYATCSHLIHAPLDMIHAQPNILIIRTDVARRQEAGQGRGKGGGVLLQGCCSFWGALRTVSLNMACNLYFELASVN